MPKLFTGRAWTASQVGPDCAQTRKGWARTRAPPCRWPAEGRCCYPTHLRCVSVRFSRVCLRTRLGNSVQAHGGNVSRLRPLHPVLSIHPPICRALHSPAKPRDECSTAAGSPGPYPTPSRSRRTPCAPDRGPSQPRPLQLGCGGVVAMGKIFDTPEYRVVDSAPGFWKTGERGIAARPSPAHHACSGSPVYSAAPHAARLRRPVCLLRPPRPARAARSRQLQPSGLGGLRGSDRRLCTAGLRSRRVSIPNRRRGRAGGLGPARSLQLVRGLRTPTSTGAHEGKQEQRGASFSLPRL